MNVFQDVKWICSCPSFIYNPAVHVKTGNHNIINSSSLPDVLAKGLHESVRESTLKTPTIAEHLSRLHERTLLSLSHNIDWLINKLGSDNSLCNSIHTPTKLAKENILDNHGFFVCVPFWSFNKIWRTGSSVTLLDFCITQMPLQAVLYCWIRQMFHEPLIKLLISIL